MTLNVPTIRRWFALACALALTVGTLAACGGGDDDGTTSSSSGGTSSSADTTGGGSTGSSTDSLSLSASDTAGLSFSKKTLTAKAGSVTLTMDNPDGNSLPHAIAVEGNGVDKDGETVQPGGTSTVTVDLKPGTYTFYCPVDGHKAGGMEGTLTVQ